MILDWVQRPLVGELPLRVCLDEAGDELTILLWLYAAGAVNEMTVRLGLCGSLAKQVELCAGEGAKFALVESPTEVAPATLRWLPGCY